MPASRKRNKGKERKAKQLANKEESDRLDARRFWRKLCIRSQCEHGCGVMISDDHPVSSFMDQFIINLYNKEMVSDNMKDLSQKYPQVWKNESYRGLAIDILIRIGTNMLLRGDDSIGGADAESKMIWPLCLAQSIVLLENYNGTGDIDSVFNSRAVSLKWRALYLGASSYRRDALKFYRKRVSCKCLKKMHLEAKKTTPKLGLCDHCEKEKERVLLDVCSRCMVFQYCSRECPDHEQNCELWANANEG